MNSIAVWLTSEEAKIFEFAPEGVKTHKMHTHGKHHAKEGMGKNHSQKGGDAEHFYHEVADYLAKTRTDRWLIMGPGLAKNHFKSHVDSHHAQQSKKILALETMDKASDGEIIDFAHDKFKKLGLFGA